MCLLDDLVFVSPCTYLMILLRIILVLQRESEHSSTAPHSSGAATDIVSSATRLGYDIGSNSPPCLVKVKVSLLYF